MLNSLPKDLFGRALWQGTWLVLPLNPYFNSTTKQESYINIFNSMNKTGVTFRELKAFIDKYIEIRNKFYIDNNIASNVQIQMQDKRFAFAISDNLFSLWDDHTQFLGEFIIDMDKSPTTEFVTWIIDTAKKYCDGIIQCGDCQRDMDKSDIGGQYFAGVYCKDCWNRKWKEIERRETYD